MSEINFSSGPPETVLDPEPPEATAQLQSAMALVDGQRDALSDVVAQWPTYLDGWAQLGRLAAAKGDHVAAYAYFRVGYHRGLDRLRGSGWRGSEYVRWAHETNRGFLRALLGLNQAAAAIGEQAEQDRCSQFLMQLDPTGVPEEELA